MTTNGLVWYWGLDERTEVFHIINSDDETMGEFGFSVGIPARWGEALFCVGGEAVHGADGTGGAGTETGGGGEADMIVTALAQRETHGELYHRWQSLSPREQEVTALACGGYTNRQIAARLGISAETIKTHLGNTLRKFRMRGKMELQTALRAWDFSEWDQ